MTDLRTAAQQALECLKGVARGKYDGNAAGVCAALEAALAQQAEPVEPVAWLRKSELEDLLTCNYRHLGADSPKIWAPYDISSPSPDMELVPLYTAPPQRKPLVDPAEYDDAGAAERYNRGLK